MPTQISGFILFAVCCFIGVVLIIGIAELINHYKGNKAVFRILIDNLDTAIKKLEKKKKHSVFIGILSEKGYDCIYIAKIDNHMVIEYEVIEEIQLSYLEKLHLYAKEHNYKIDFTTRGNQPLYKTEDTATVLQIEPEGASPSELAEIVKDIQETIFENTELTEYELIS
jgi:hypothetical protein